MNLLRVFIIVGLLMALTSCGGKKEVKPEPEEALQTEKAIDVVMRIRDAYLRKDLQEIKNLTTERGYLEIVGAIKEFESASLEFRPRWVEIDREGILLYIDWKGQWKVRGETYERRGLASFSLKGSPPRLDGVLRANPFEEPR